MKYSYVIIDDDNASVLETQAAATRFQNLVCAGTAGNYDDGLNLILEHNPQIVFLEIAPADKKSNLSLQLVNELYRYLKVIPKIIITTKDKAHAFDAIKYEVLDYFIKPVGVNDLRKTILKLTRTTEINATSLNELVVENDVTQETYTGDEADISYAEQSSSTEIASQPILNQSNQSDKPLIICVKSYGDYRYIEAKDIRYLQADNNSTDIHLNNGEMITAFKTLKHFEGVLLPPFVRIHNSYIVNVNHVSRIHTGNAVCYITNTTTKLPFSKSYKENVDSIINSISNGNYLEI